jgi:hypothetical protein
MSDGRTPFGIFVKWVVVPASVCALGFFVIGPQLGGNVPKDMRQKLAKGEEFIEKIKTKIEPGAGDSKASGEKRFAEPEVEVDVQPLR